MKTDLSISRVLNAPRKAVWQAWEDPQLFVKWWAPAPVVTTSNKHQFFAGGGFDTSMTLEDGTVVEGGEGCFLEVIEFQRIVFTDALMGAGARTRSPSLPRSSLWKKTHRALSTPRPRCTRTNRLVSNTRTWGLSMVGVPLSISWRGWQSRWSSRRRPSLA